MIVYVSSNGSSGLSNSPPAKTAAHLGGLAAQPAPIIRFFEALQFGAELWLVSKRPQTMREHRYPGLTRTEPWL